MIRLAHIDEAGLLSDLAVRAKAFWPYDEQFIQDCKDDLQLNPAHVDEEMVYVYELDGQVIGYYGFDSTSNEPEMICLFVEPDFIGKGIGSILWKHSVEFAKSKEWTSFKIVADPYAAENFYLKVGCTQIGVYQSPVRADRKLPLLEYKLENGYLDTVFKKEEVIETKRMILRPVCLNDHNLFLDLDSDSDVMRYLTDGVPSNEEQISKFTKHATELTKKHNSNFGYWVAKIKDTDDFLGWFHFRPGKDTPENTERIELGYRLKKKFWGKGYATEGSKALIDIGFNELGVKTVFAQTMKSNIPSQKVMKKCGLTFSHEFFHPDFPDSEDKEVEYVLEKAT